jgi:hypothetical protein
MYTYTFVLSRETGPEGMNVALVSYVDMLSASSILYSHECSRNPFFF